MKSAFGGISEERMTSEINRDGEKLRRMEEYQADRMPGKRPRRAQQENPMVSCHRPVPAGTSGVVKLGKNAGLCPYVDCKGCRKYR